MEFVINLYLNGAVAPRTGPCLFRSWKLKSKFLI